MEKPLKDPEGIEKKTLHKFADFSGRTVLEIGCGEGRLTWRYAASARRVVGFDTDHSALRIARADAPAALQNRVHFAGASAGNIPFPDETFDIAVLAWSL